MKTPTVIRAGALAALMGWTAGCSHSSSAADASPAPAAAQNGNQASQPTAKADDAFRLQVPVPGTKPELHAPVPVKKVLANGLTVLAVHKPALPLVSVALVVRSGSAQDPENMPGLAGFMGEMLKTGTDTRKAEQIDHDTEMRGAGLDVDVDEDAITVSTASLTENFGSVFDVLADVVQHTTFDPAEIKRVAEQRQNTLEEASKDPKHAAKRVFRKLVYGEHPYGHMPLGEAKSVTKISRNELKGFHAKHFRPANAGVIVVGDLSAENAFAEVEARLGKWKGAPKVQDAPKEPKALPAGLVLVSKAGAPQSQLVVGELAVKRADADYFPLVLCNAILGGLFNSRINMNLREDKGYTYGAHSYFDFMRERGPFFVATGVKTDVTDLAIREILKEIDKMRTSNVTEEELNNAKNRYSLSLPGYFQTVDGISGMMANLYLYDLPLDYFQQVPDRINAVSVADVRRVAEQHLHPEALSIVVVGDDNHVGPGLADLQRGPVQKRDAEGNVVATKAEAPQKAAPKKPKG